MAFWHYSFPKRLLANVAQCIRDVEILINDEICEIRYWFDLAFAEHNNEVVLITKRRKKIYKNQGWQSLFKYLGVITDDKLNIKSYLGRLAKKSNGLRSCWCTHPKKMHAYHTPSSEAACELARMALIEILTSDFMIQSFTTISIVDNQYLPNVFWNGERNRTIHLKDAEFILSSQI